jgi:hypothetical protein
MSKRKRQPTMAELVESFNALCYLGDAKTPEQKRQQQNLNSQIHDLKVKRKKCNVIGL